MAKVTGVDRKLTEILNGASKPNFALLNCNSDNFQSDYGRALDWIHHSVEDDELVRELITYLQFSNRADDVALVKMLDGVQTKLLGSIAYCINRGAELAPKSLLRITNTLQEARNKVVDAPVAEGFEDLPETANSRNMEAYKSCYSRLDNLRALVCNGKLALKDVHDEAMKILEAHGGLKANIRRKLVDHYTQSVEEAQEDKVIKTWVKPLQAILKAVGGVVKADKAKKTAKAVPAVKADKPVKAPKVAKPVKGKTVKATKVAKNTKPAKGKATKTVTIKPKRDAGVPSVASQVRDLIRVNKNSTDELGMVEIVVRELGLTSQRGKSVVKAFWGNVEA
jgi:hypothetical protein